MADNQIQLPAGYEGYKPAEKEKEQISLPAGYEDYQPQAQSVPPQGVPQGTITAGKGGVGGWLEDVESDLRYGGESTLPGRIMRKLGAPGINRGVSEGQAQFMGGSVVAPVHAAEAGHELITGHPIKAINKAAETAGDLALPAAAVAPATILPRMAGAIAGSKVAGKIAPIVTKDPDYQELITNVGGAAGASAPEITPPLIRGAGKTYNVGKGVIGKVAPIAGKVETVYHALHGNTPAAIAAYTGGGLLGEVGKLPEASEAITKFRFPKINMEPAAPETAEPSTKMRSVGQAAEPAELSPQQLHSVVREQVFNLRNTKLQDLAKEYDIDPEAEQYKYGKGVKRTEATDTSTGQKQSGREKLADAIMSKMSDDEIESIGRNARDLEHKAEMAGWHKADRAETLFPKLRKPEEPELIKGPKVKSVSDISPLTMKLVQSLQIDPVKVLDDFTGTESQLRSRLLKASADDLAKWHK